ncbi:hypothetical protein R3X27_02920 [Tropicimonas sp. TH_r6]|uniref:hypothetical protein n=1 Tax=Tropicimonas sp. TH_r6 TaxID=3082085 RepID=UPI002954CEED|nr:hypothetical protein [Tropicimonas sp. TH_r6]MDV7141627.1 hypothetical protein [Tropicimonas sp. TH_r6]
MHKNMKVATCSYCGTRAALVLGRERHELVCSSCGAALGALKSLKDERSARKPGQGDVYMSPASQKPKKGKPSKKKKSKKRGVKHLFGKIVDEIEDLFD